MARKSHDWRRCEERGGQRLQSRRIILEPIKTLSQLKGSDGVICTTCRSLRETALYRERLHCSDADAMISSGCESTRPLFRFLKGERMKRALLVIDVQREYFDGAFPIRHPVGHLESILEVMDQARDAKVPTAVIRHHQPDPESPVFCKDSEMWQLLPEVESRHRDALIDKSLPGSFTNTDLEEFLKSNDIDTVSIAGYMTQVCCDTTARQAFHRGYQVEFLNDATGTLDVSNKAGSVTAEQLHESTLVAQQMFISDVIDRSEWSRRL